MAGIGGLGGSQSPRPLDFGIFPSGPAATLFLASVDVTAPEGDR